MAVSLIFLDVKGKKVLSSEIYAIHAIPLKDKSVQLGMINVPIFDVTGEIEAPWIDKTDNIITSVQPGANNGVQNAHISTNKPTSSVMSNTQTVVTNDAAHEIASQPPGKKMKMVQKTRTFMHDGYQQVETYNELVPCDDNEMEETITKTQPSQPAAPAKAKQSSMMSFFKKK